MSEDSQFREIVLELVILLDYVIKFAVDSDYSGIFAGKWRFTILLFCSKYSMVCKNSSFLLSRVVSCCFINVALEFTTFTFVCTNSLPTQPLSLVFVLMRFV